jgi:hypothetical protein
MKIILITLLITSILSILGMFYWMYKSKSGELKLSSKSWHFKLLHWMWDIEFWEIKNACPYYWSIVVSLLLLPVYSVLRGLYIVGNWIFNKIPSINWSFLNKLKFLDKLPEINIPSSKKETYSLIYKKGKQYLINGFIGLLLLIALIGLIALYILPFLKFNLTAALLITGFMSYVLISYTLAIIKPEWDKYHIDHYKNFGLGLFGIVSIPFVVIYYILESIFSKLFKTIKDYCPPIVWK